MQHLLSLFDVSTDDLRQILAAADLLKARLRRGDRPPVLERLVLALLFEKPSLRTRVSFETGIAQLGGLQPLSGRGSWLGDTRIGIRLHTGPGAVR